MKKSTGSKTLSVKVMRTKMMISCENAKKVTTEGKFSCAAYKKGVGNNTIFCQFLQLGV